MTIDGVGDAYIRKLSYDDVMGYVRGDVDEDERFVMVRMIIAGVCDAEGTPLFTREDADAVGSLGMQLVRQLAEAVQEHGGVLDGMDDVPVGN